MSRPFLHWHPLSHLARQDLARPPRLSRAISRRLPPALIPIISAAPGVSTPWRAVLCVDASTILRMAVPQIVSPSGFFFDARRVTKHKRLRACATRSLLVGGPVDGFVAAHGAMPGQPSQKERRNLGSKPDPRVGFDKLGKIVTSRLHAPQKSSSHSWRLCSLTRFGGLAVGPRITLWYSFGSRQFGKS